MLASIDHVISCFFLNQATHTYIIFRLYV